MSTGHHTDTLDTVPASPAAARRRWPSSSPPSPRRSPGRGSCTTTARAGCWPWRCSAAPASGCSTTSGHACSTRSASSDAAWTTWAGSDLGFSGLHITTDTVARLGLLLLQDGVWQGRQVLPAGWVATASSALADTSHHPDPADWGSATATRCGAARHGFRADGAYGQFALVLPHHDLVVAVTSCTETTHEVLDAVWEELLPAPRRRSAAGRSRCAGPAPVGPRGGRGPTTGSTTAAPAAPAALDLHPHAHGRAPGAAVGRGAPPRAAGCSRSTTAARCASPAVTGSGRMPVRSPWVASGGWVAPGVFEATVVALETPHSLLLRCADGMVTAPGAAPRCTARGWPGCGRRVAEPPTAGGRLVPCSR